MAKIQKNKLTTKQLVEELNRNKRIKLRLNKTAQHQGVLLDYSRNGVRERVFINVLLSLDECPSKLDKEQLYRADLIRNKKELELFSNAPGFVLQTRSSNADFIEYFKYVQKLNGLSSYLGSIKQLQEFLKSSNLPSELSFKKIDKNFCNKFRDYLIKVVANPTARTYLGVFRATLNKAKAENLIHENPCSGISIKLEAQKRGFLTEEELTAFINASSTIDREVQNAFIFSAQTSLRLGDLRALKFSDIKNGYLYFKQQKTKGLLHIKISNLAQKIIVEQRKRHPKTEFVFELQKSRTSINDKLDKIGKSVSITKDLHIHMARHTFATLALTKGVDIYTVSKYMGHTSVATTEIYSNLVDQKMNEVADKINVEITPKKRTSNLLK